MKASLLLLISSTCLTLTSQAALLAGFNFNNATAGVSGGLGTFVTGGSVEVFNTTTEVITPATHGEVATTATINLAGLVGTMGGTANNNWGTFAGDTGIGGNLNAVGSDAAGQALAVVGSGNNTSSAVITVATTGYTDVVVSYITRGTSTGFSTHTWEYSGNGTTYLPVSTITGRNVTAWSLQTVDLSAIPSADNLSMLWLRVTFSGASSATGNNRLDNLQINAVPEPTIALIGSLGLLSLLRRRR